MKIQVKWLLVMWALLAGLQGADAQPTFIPLYSFTGGNDGANPVANLMQANDGNLYGTTYEGGTNGYGTIFRISTSGALTPLYSFTNGNDGANPYAGLVQASDGALYGTTQYGGTNDYGAIFRTTTNGAFIPLYSFTGGHDGANPRGGLTLANDGNLYGTTENGGTNFDGTVFRITPSGALTSLYSFTGGHDGSYPVAGLVQASDGKLYGTTYEGGTNGYGVVFRITTNGVLTPLYSFTDGHDGAYPVAGLVQASDGNLYGTAEEGGTNFDGAIFQIKTNGVLTPLYSFTDGNDGAAPSAALVQANDGNLYGTAYEGGANDYGSVFRVTTNGVLTPLYSFTNGRDGADPLAGLTLAGNGNLYGTAPGGGTNHVGTVFELSFPPVLNILSNGRLIVLSWPAWASNYVLQSATNLVSPNWTTVSNTVQGMTVTVTNSFPSQFFRLVSP
ncbi:MAG TPA: choice-of-anchor tandem repeat GloVer-containing protein [Pseudomonadales bacterium]|nr:choice-of-anchor tandem repeat GloVer-containing protein [Pseudomonadales bacterium]